MSQIPIVQDFEDIFQYILELPPKREIDFNIDLVLRALPIFRTLYQMVPTEMLELKKQVQELEGLSFVRPSTSPWEALVLFMKKKDGMF